MTGSILTAEQRAAFERDGYVMVRKLFDDEEITILRTAIEDDPALRSSLYDRRDAAGKSTRMAIWNHPGESVYGLAARSHRVVDTMEDLLGGEVYHYHSKLTAKEPLDGGAWEWHQDYGYWYHNGIVYPAHGERDGCPGPRHARERLPAGGEGLAPLRTDRAWRAAGRAGGRGSEACRGDPQAHAHRVRGDGARRRAVLPRNVLHRSDQNRSPNRRWTVLHCYNAARNNPYLEHHHPMYTPLEKVDDGAIKQAGVKFAELGRRVPREVGQSAGVEEADRLGEDFWIHLLSRAGEDSRGVLELLGFPLSRDD